MSSNGSCGSFHGVLAIMLVIFAIVAQSSAQITFSRNWARGKYPSDDKIDGDGSSAEFQRGTRAVYPKSSYAMYVKPTSNPEYVHILVSGPTLENILGSIKQQACGMTSISANAAGATRRE